jgi:hypothetical protein
MDVLCEVHLKGGSHTDVLCEIHLKESSHIDVCVMLI